MAELTPLTALALVALGFGASAYGVLVGSGGGFIVSPLLILLFGLDHTQAAGTSLVTVFLSSAAGAVPYLRLRRVDMRSALLFSLAAIPGSILGVFGVKAVAGPLFNGLFGALLAVIGLFVFLRPNPTSERVGPPIPEGAAQGRLLAALSRWPGTTTRRLTTREGRAYQYTFFEPGAVAVNVLFGFISSFFGIGGGPVRLPALVYLFRFPVLVAVATSVVTMAVYTGIGSLAHLLSGHVSIPVALLVGLGGAAGAPVGVRLSRAMRAPWVLRLLAVALILLGARLVLAGLR